MHHTALLLLRLFGARALPARSVRWDPPMLPEVWDEFRGRLRRQLGGFDEIAVAERTQVQRSGFALLLLDRGRPRAFVKLRRGDPAVLRREQDVIDQIGRAAPRSFSIPGFLGAGRTEDWSYIAVEPLPSISHRVPRDPPLEEITAEIGAALEGLPRDLAAPLHWQPMHGDLTPWNLREIPGGGRVLFDWEDAAWAPPGADEVLYRASAAAIGAGEPSGSANWEAIHYWIDRISARGGENKRDRGLDEALLRNLGGMRGRAATVHAPGEI